MAAVIQCVISEQEARVVCQAFIEAWYEGLETAGDTTLIRKLLVYYPSLEPIIGQELESEEKYRKPWR